MNKERPDPDALLARVREEEHRATRGKLRIFFGYAAGVGKTYAMLKAAQAQRVVGTDIVVGYVELHGRLETEAILKGLESLPTLSIAYRGAMLHEFDLDAALARRPEIVVVDELAHTNAVGMRHPKRWQDVEELLSAGVDVWTTLNVQHIESLNDVISQITSVVVKETLPDTVVERADEIELIDITPDALMDRLAAGKVYIPKQAEQALKNFFQKGNLVALRELSLRQAASRVQRDVENARLERASVSPWLTSDRLLVCVGPSPTNARIIRATKRLASSLGAEWLAVAVDRGIERHSAPFLKEQTSRNLRFAEQLGAETLTLVGGNVADTLLDFAHSRNVTKIVAGKSAQPRWKQWIVGTVVDQLLSKSGDIDVYVVSGEGDETAPIQYGSPPKGTRWNDYFKAGAIVACCTLLAWEAWRAGLADANIVMIYLAGVAIVARLFGRGPSVAASIACVLLFDFFLVAPHLTFAVSDTEYLITFAVMLGIGLLISELTSRLQSQLRASQQQEHRTAQLYRMTRQLTELAGSDFLVRTAGRQLEEIFDGEVVIYLRESRDDALLRFGERSSIVQNPINEVVAQWVATNGRTAGANTNTLPNATALFVALAGSQQVLGSLGIAPHEPNHFLNPEQVRLLETCGSLIALSLERDQSMLKAHEAELQVRSEQLRNSLLNSVSHDLRTPLATIAGTASGLRDTASDTDRESLQTIVEESHRLTRLVENLLEMARLDAGSITLNRQWHVLEEVAGIALNSAKRELQHHRVYVNIPADFPLLNIDGFLMEQVLVNLLENASRYTPAGSAIEISAAIKERSIEIRVADNGPGLPPGSEEKVFDKFFRGASVSPDGRRGVGLGLAICRAIIDAHHGKITASNRRRGGAEFTINLPCNETPPRVDAELVAATGRT
ncbi:MAG: sensor histidine kinase KdpD [Pirellulales bacterium]|nr:sensor histidine kinase KdpD [Pirellulales bacterium]